MNTHIILLAGPSDSSKTSLLRRVGAKRLKLDDFYRDGDEAGMPLVGGGITGGAGSGPRGAGSRETSRIDWDHPDSWDAERAMRAILDLCVVGWTEVSIYSIPGNAAVRRAGLDINREALERVRFLVTQARDSAPWYQHTVLGWNYRLSNVLAAINRGQMLHLDERVAARRRIFGRVSS